MNKIFNHIAIMILTAFAAISFTSCTSDDIDQAYNINGIWQGSIQGNYYGDRYNESGSWDTEIQFVQDGDFSRGGYGTEVDYSYDTGRTMRSDFDWEVRNGEIYMDYDDGYRIIIHDYDLYTSGSSMRFRGYFEDYDTGDALASFNLIKISNWTDYAKQHTSNFNDSIATKQ